MNGFYLPHSLATPAQALAEDETLDGRPPFLSNSLTPRVRMSYALVPIGELDPDAVGIYATSETSADSPGALVAAPNANELFDPNHHVDAAPLVYVPPGHRIERFEDGSWRIISPEGQVVSQGTATRVQAGPHAATMAASSGGAAATATASVEEEDIDEDVSSGTNDDSDVVHGDLRLARDEQRAWRVHGPEGTFRIADEDVDAARAFLTNPGRVYSEADVIRLLPLGGRTIKQRMGYLRSQLNKALGRPVIQTVLEGGSAVGWYNPETDGERRRDNPFYETHGPLTVNRGTAEVYINDVEAPGTSETFEWLRELIDAGIQGRRAYPTNPSVALRLRRRVAKADPSLVLYDRYGNSAGITGYGLHADILAPTELAVGWDNARVTFSEGRYTLHWDGAEIPITLGQGQLLFPILVRRGRLATYEQLERYRQLNANGAPADKRVPMQDMLTKLRRSVTERGAAPFDLVTSVPGRGFAAWADNPAERAAVFDVSVGGMQLDTDTDRAYLGNQRIVLPMNGGSLLRVLDERGGLTRAELASAMDLRGKQVDTAILNTNATLNGAIVNTDGVYSLDMTRFSLP